MTGDFQKISLMLQFDKKILIQNEDFDLFWTAVIFFLNVKMLFNVF